MIQLDPTNHLLIPNMIVLKFISGAKLNVIVNCNKLWPFGPTECKAHIIMVCEQIYSSFF